MAPKAQPKIVNLADVSKEKLADAKIEVTAIANCIIRFSDGTCAIVGSQEVKSVNDAKLEQFVAASSIQEVMAAAHSTGLEQSMLDARNKAFGESYAETVCNHCNDLATPPEAAAVTKSGKKNLLYGRLPLVTRGLLYSPLIYLSRVGRSITAQVGLVLAARG